MSSDKAKAGYDLVDASADYPARNGPPTRSIVICTHQRSGSTMLGEAITFAGEMGIPLEYFHRGFRPALEARWEAADTADYVAKLHRHRTASSGIFAIKLFWQDVIDIAAEHDPELAQLRAIAPGEPPEHLYRRARAVFDTILPNPFWISLERMDTVRQAVSLERAVQTNIWRDIGARDLSGAPKPAYNFEALAARLHWIQRARSRWRSFFAANGILPQTILYEEMIRDPGVVLKQLCSLTGRECPPLPTVRSRRQADRLSEDWTRQFLSDYQVRDQPLSITER